MAIDNITIGMSYYEFDSIYANTLQLFFEVCK